MVFAALLCGILPVFAFAEPIETNLAAGLRYTIETGEPVSMSYANFTDGNVEFDLDEEQLTDLYTAPISSKSGSWYRAYRGRSRIVTFDFGASCAVSRVEAGFLHSKTQGIYAPRYINVYLSDNGVDYGTVAEYITDFPQSTAANMRYDAVVDLGKTYSARFVKVEFCCDNFAYCDEISIIGTKTLNGDETEVTPDEEEKPGTYLRSVGDITDIVKLFNGYHPTDKELTSFTEEELLPYVAYVDSNGEVAGKMFDSLVFLPYNCDYPSGGRLVKTVGDSGAIKSDFELYFDYTFGAGKDLDALDNVVGDVYATLGINDKFSVFLTLPYPTVLNKPFGDVDNDTFDEYCAILDERLAVVKWYTDKCIAAFAEKGYENIELAGFYWGNGEVNYTDSTHEFELITSMNAYIRLKGLYTLFDSGYLATGFDHWKTLGFTAAVMQPNAAYSVSKAESYYFESGMLAEFAQSAEKHNLGIEIETDVYSAFEGDDYLKAGYNYENYLYQGYKNGCMNGLTTYNPTEGRGTYYEFCYADTSTPKGIYLRRLYDLTYSYIHRTYANVAPVISIEQDVEVIYGDEKVTVNIGITDSDSHWENIAIEFTSKPLHGSVAAAASKKALIYSVDPEYLGEDSFTVRVGDGFSYSEEVTVNVTVALPEPSEPPEGSDPNVSFDISGITLPPAEQTTPVWLIVLLAVLAAAMVGVAVVTIAKSRKKQ